MIWFSMGREIKRKWKQIGAHWEGEKNLTPLNCRLCWCRQMVAADVLCVLQTLECCQPLPILIFNRHLYWNITLVWKMLIAFKKFFKFSRLLVIKHCCLSSWNFTLQLLNFSEIIFFCEKLVINTLYLHHVSLWRSEVPDQKLAETWEGFQALL